MFELKKSNGNINVVGNVIKNVDLKAFLNKRPAYSDIIFCPTHAIDITKKEILQDKCISCGICFIKLKNQIFFDSKYQKNLFFKYCNGKKDFIYLWLSQILTDYSGIDITSAGYSRIIRIPLLLIKDHKLFIVKVSRNLKDVERHFRELEDILDLIKEEVSNYSVSIIDIVVNFDTYDSKYLNKFKNCIFLDFNKMLDLFLKENCGSITNFIELSRC
jgi:NAD-dependent dihydropyrimidine dehydrogenase PreA subunit